MTFLPALLGLEAVWQFETALAALLHVSALAVIATLGARLVGRRAESRDAVWKTAFLVLAGLPAAAFVVPMIPIGFELPMWMVRLDNPVALTGIRGELAGILGYEMSNPGATRRGAVGPGAYSAIMLVWALGSAVVLARAAVGATRMRHWIRRAHVVSDSRWELTCRVREELQIERNVRLLESDDFAVPFTYGFRRPAIVLPAESASWTSERVRVVLVHELTHVLRRDWIWQLIALAACAVYWFHPGTWWLARRRRLDAELICDAQVLAFGGRRSVYARTLFEIATGFSDRRLTPAGALPFIVRSDLEHRVRTILDPRNSPLPGRPSRLAPVLLVILVLIVAAYRPHAEGCARPTKVAAGIRTAQP